MIYKDYFRNLIGGVVVALFTFFLYKLVLLDYGNQELEFFTLVKRYQTVLFPILMLGFGVLIPKLLIKESIDYKVIKGMVLVSSIFFSLFAILFYFFDNVWFYACLYTFPIVLSTFIFSIYRGGMLFQKGINSNYLFLVIIPLFLYLMTNNIKSFFMLYFFVSIAFFIYFFKKIADLDFLKNVVDFDLKSLIYNGFQRVPGDVISQFILLFPLYSLNEKIYRSGEYALAISIVVAFSIPIKPLGTVLLVYLSKGVINRNKVIKSLIYYFFISMIFTILYLLLIKYFNNFYFKTSSFYLILSNLSPMVFLSTIYIFLRSYVDSFYKAALLSYINIFIVSIYGILIFFDFDSVFSLNTSYGLGVVLVVLAILYKVKK
ncbi:hypothetical protein KTJ53_07950 [Acinetobacter variabilis]|uniref:hypothetical protein n=1 Tax=Acinetobacter variabilis TaxID=70346 RepID=UPI0021D1FFDA|nr:hypothetical protein [Acinetobacter variabilis]MCU4629628.1 hypothetical protein [Acinetobacter variabilis]